MRKSVKYIGSYCPLLLLLVLSCTSGNLNSDTLNSKTSNNYKKAKDSCGLTRVTLPDKAVDYDTVFIRKSDRWNEIKTIKPVLIGTGSPSNFVVEVSEIIDTSSVLSWDTKVEDEAVICMTHYETFKASTNLKVFRDKVLIFNERFDSQTSENWFLNTYRYSKDTFRLHNPVYYAHILYDSMREAVVMKTNHNYFIIRRSGENYTGRIADYDVMFEYKRKEEVLITDYEYVDIKTFDIVCFDDLINGTDYRVLQSLFHPDGTKFFLVNNSSESDRNRLVVFSVDNKLLLNVDCRVYHTWLNPMAFINDSLYTIVYNPGIDSLLIIDNRNLPQFKWEPLDVQKVQSQEEIDVWNKNSDPPNSITFYNKDVSVQTKLLIDSVDNRYVAYKLIGLGYD